MHPSGLLKEGCFKALLLVKLRNYNHRLHAICAPCSLTQTLQSTPAMTVKVYATATHFQLIMQTFFIYIVNIHFCLVCKKI